MTNNITTLIITREHDKLSMLEIYINNDKLLETLVSNYIDYSINKQYNLAIEHYKQIKEKITEPNLFKKIIKLSISIIKQTPYKIIIKQDKNI